MPRHAAKSSGPIAIAKAHHRPQTYTFPSTPGRMITQPPERLPPPGWSVEADRQEEFLSLSYTALMSKMALVND